MKILTYNTPLITVDSSISIILKFITCRAAMRAFAAAGLFLIGNDASSQSYRYTDLGTLGGTYSIGTGINNAGQISGFSYLAGDAVGYAVVWNGTTPTILGTSGGTTFASGINNSGQVFGGMSSNGSGYPGSGAVVWNGGTPTTLNSLNGATSVITGLNKSGMAVGTSSFPDGRWRATVWNGTIPTDLGSPFGGSFSGANGINDSGQIVGYGSTSDNVVSSIQKVIYADRSSLSYSPATKQKSAHDGSDGIEAG